MFDWGRVAMLVGLMIMVVGVTWLCIAYMYQILKNHGGPKRRDQD